MTYRVGNVAIDPATEEGQTLLAKVHQERGRITCSCRSPAPEMYVSCFAGRFIVKRMPGSGADHGPGCDSFLPPEELSGLSQVQGTAIKEDPVSGTTKLAVDFKLSLGSKRPAPTPPSGNKPTEAKAPPRKLGLTSLLNYLWHEGDLVKWTPAMEGRRWWGPVRHALRSAAFGKVAKSRSLNDILYIPAPWKAERKAELAAGRQKLFSTLQQGTGTAPLGLLVAEYKNHEQTRLGGRFLFKHAPDCAFFADADLVKRFETVFADQLMLADVSGNAHVIVIATFSVAKAGYPVLQEIGMMLVTANWIPFEHLREHQLVTALTEQKRHFLKSLRFNLHTETAIASAVLTDLSQPVALFTASHSAQAGELAALHEAAGEGIYPSWLWLEEDQLPELPGENFLNSKRRTVA